MSKPYTIKRLHNVVDDGEYNAEIVSTRLKNGKILVVFRIDENEITKFYEIDFSPYSALWYLFSAVNQEFEGDFDFDEFCEMITGKALNIEIENVCVDSIDYCNVTKTYPFESLQ